MSDLREAIPRYAMAADDAHPGYDQMVCHADGPWVRLEAVEAYLREHDAQRATILLHKARACIIAADSELSAIHAHRPPDRAEIDAWVREARRIEREIQEWLDVLDALGGSDE